MSKAGLTCKKKKVREYARTTLIALEEAFASGICVRNTPMKNRQIQSAMTGEPAESAAVMPMIDASSSRRAHSTTSK